MDELLQLWELQSLIPGFNDQNIDLDVCSNLDCESIKELIKDVGNRIKFKKKWEEHFNKKLPSYNSFDAHTPEGNFSQNEGNDYQNSSQNENDDPNKENNEIQYIGERMYRALNLPSVKDTLIQSKEGKAILKYYSKHNDLTSEHRDRMVDLEITNAMDKTDGSLTKHEFKHFASNVKEIFAIEDFNIYYVSPIKKMDCRDNQSVPVRGKFAGRYKIKLQQCKRLLGSESSRNFLQDLDDDPDFKTNEVKGAGVPSFT
ncbi:uncharacterized protein LOC117168919 [Belonocnema kinseyi]|uniref:uncharacterized protein LOC117168919 n=1 Tax=Belonocnema kinseyi TaxID=2817044 RepID=UPI00143D42EC|nr:uncharacterized protein LOC117168919 [Belonocnema kinseyi]XP_033210769.1 uncharacterized protein LOC117168919 [Belonocnema kinseyi]XP_033210770.1 uncharacterized protein LOC117168919 [Belonocnema kinseyi]